MKGRIQATDEHLRLHGSFPDHMHLLHAITAACGGRPPESTPWLVAAVSSGLREAGRGWMAGSGSCGDGIEVVRDSWL